VRFNWKRERPAETVLIHAKDHKIGDAFLQAPFFQAARARFPEARITLAVSLGGTPYSTSLAPVAAPYLDEIIEDAHLCDDWRQILGPRPLGGRRFDLVVDMQKTWWRTLAVRRIRHRMFVSAAKHYAFSDRRPPAPIKPPRLIDQLIKLLEAACAAPRAAAVPLQWYGAAERAAAERALPDGPPAIGFAPGAGEAFKRWPLERYLAVALAQIAKGRRAVFVLGPQEAGWIEAIRRVVPQAILPGWGGPEGRGAGLAPREVAAMASRLAAAVANDCGAAHILAAGGVPMLSLFGATNPTKYLPATRRLRVIQAAAGGPRAIEAITVESVLAALEELLAESEAARPAPAAADRRSPG
jgi:ADP-heptose:LPS heptosyltransferase